jgi:hypothetical protein
MNKIFVFVFVFSNCVNKNNKQKMVNEKIKEAFHQEEFTDSSNVKMYLLMGEDGGGWFSISKEDDLKVNEYRIKIYFEDKSLLADLVFETNQKLDLNEEYKFIPLSHGEICTILQKKKKIILRYVRDYSTRENL